MVKSIAVLVPVYARDNPLWFQECLNSIFFQLPIAECEVHVYIGIDGPISQEIELIISQYSLLVFRVIRNDVNLGLATNLNNLINSLCDESIIFRMDADDRCINERFHRQLEFLIANPLIDILGASMLIIDENGNRLPGISSYPLDHTGILRYFPFGNPIAHPVVCVRRHVLEQLNGYRIKYFPEDLDLWYRAAVSGYKFANLQMPLLEFRIPGKIARKRGRSWALREFNVNLHGLWHLRRIYLIFIPLIRLFVRLSPSFLINFIYYLRYKYSGHNFGR